MSSFENFRRLTNFTQDEKIGLKEHCFARKVDVEGHFLYMGRDIPSYGQTTFDFRGTRYHFYRHQLALFLKKLEEPDFSFVTWDNPSMTTSHLCTKKRCINPTHLELESAEMNNSRIGCFRAGQSFGHSQSPNCIL